MPNPATASIPFVGAPCTTAAGLGLVGRDAGGGNGRGALGGGAGGPSPTTGMPKSSSGKEERVLSPFRILVRDPERGGKGERARSGSGMALSLSSGTVGVVARKYLECP